MTKEMIISSNGHETIVAILEDDLVAEIFVERDGFLYVADVIDTLEEFEKLESADEDGAGEPSRSGKDRERDDQSRPQTKIEDLLKEGQEILVQVVKEPLGTKGARLTSHVTMPGRFLVFMPTVDHVGVSRKIESADERNRSHRAGLTA